MDFLTVYYLITIGFCLLYFLLISKYSYAWSQIETFSVDLFNIPEIMTTVIIPARNEEKNILNCLEHLANQDYPKSYFEILVIDDNSTDLTVELCINFFSRHPELNGKVLKTGAQGIGKKRAITLGVGEARGDLILTTDADCIFGNSWLKTIIGFHDIYRPKMIVAPVLLKNGPSIFQKIQSLEFAGLIAAGGAAVKCRKPIMCNGANLGFEKEAFISVSGYNSSCDILSGDDIFLMNAIHKKYPGEVRFLKAGKAVVFANAPSTFTDFINQRMRWVSKVRFIPDLNTIFVGVIVYALNFSILSGIFIWLFNPYFNGVILIIIFGFKLIIDFLFLYLASVYIKEKKLLWYLIPAELLNLLYVTIIGILGNIAGYSWKGRYSHQKYS